MKRQLFHSALFACCLSFFGSHTVAQTIIVNEHFAKNIEYKLIRPKIDLSKYNKRVSVNGLEVYNKKDELLPSRRIKANDYATVTFKFQYDALKFNPMGDVNIYGENIDYTSYYADYDFESGTYQDLVCQVPKGNCDVLATALPLIDGIYKMGVADKIIEQVTINQDTTIIIDFNDCTNQYNFKSFKRDGEEAKLDIYLYNDNYEVEDIIKGNINGYGDQISIILKGIGMVAEHFVYVGCEIYGGYLASTVFINDVSDRYKIGATRMFDDDSDVYVVKYETQTMSDHILQNDASNYTSYQEQFTPSLSYNLNGEGLMGLEAISTIDNANIGSLIFGYSPVQDYTTKVYIDATQGASNELGKYDVLVCPEFVDKVKTQIYTNSWENEDGEIITEVDTIQKYLSIYGIPVLINNNKVIEYVNASHDMGGNIAFHIPDGGGDLVEYPGHSRFSFYMTQKVLEYGSNCPINAFMAQNKEGAFLEGKLPVVDCCYVGRYGEVRNADLDTLETVIKYNDETICDNYETREMDLYNFFIQGHPDGVITAHFVNSNMMVDGLQGMNMTDVYFDQRQEDWTAPTVQMLLFKDTEGNIIDRFETAEDGVLEFAGGDFNFQMDMDTYYYWFDCKPQMVEVSYSPYGADDWALLEVNEIPEEFFMPGFGYFYRGSLKNVTGCGEKGWFDLKIKLTDLSGNWQEQVVSPAFRIGDGSQSGIEAIKSGTPAEVARYTIDGRSISRPQTGVNIIKMSDGTVKKVLVE